MRARWVLIGALVALAWPASGCIEPQLVECADGRACAPGQVCDLVHVTCVEPDQLAACIEKPDGTDCTWSRGSGRCFGGVCLPIGCGNHVIESGELCDDGNRVSNDGCSAECTSTEVCGNGVADPVFGEHCDDGNQQSHDGCDSSCQREHADWQVIGIRPMRSQRGSGAFDEVRGRFVHFAQGLTWEWNAGWLLASNTAPSTPRSYALVYDSDRQRVVLVGSTNGSTIDLVWDWDGAAWQPRATTGIAGRMGVATYDRTNQRIVLATNTEMSILDAASMWTTAPAPQQQSDVSIAYDGRTQTIIMVVAGYLTSLEPYTYSPPKTWQLSGSTWTEKTAATSRPRYLFSAPELVWDQGRGALFAFGGAAEGAPNPFDAVYPGLARTWQDPDWQVEPIGTGMPRANFEVVYDPTNTRLIAFGGSGQDDVQVLGTTDAVWTKIVESAPQTAVRALAAFDSRLDRLVLLQIRSYAGPAETWLWNGTWQNVATTNAPPIDDSYLVHDPVRERVVLLEAGGTWTFDGADWTRLGAGVPSPYGLVFDPSRAQLLAIAYGGVHVLGSTDVAWTRISDALTPGTNQTSFAFDARNNCVVAVDRSDGRGYEFDGSDWQPTLSPSRAGYQATADTRRGSVWLVHSTEGPWEHLGSTWSEYDPMPIEIIGQPVYDPIAGRLLIVGESNASRLIVTRRLQSTLANETCAAGVDADGDGSAGCDDDDCWWTCTPACPPFASCP